MACHPIPQASASTVQRPVLASGGGNIRQESAATIIRHVSHFLAHLQGRWLREWGVQALSRGGISMGAPWQKTSGLPYTVPLRIALPFPPSTKGVIRRPGLAGPIWHRAYWNDWSTWYLSFSEFTCSCISIRPRRQFQGLATPGGASSAGGPSPPARVDGWPGFATSYCVPL